jgi:putative addiction module killer protein
MIEVRQTAVFAAWLRRLADREASRLVRIRVARLEAGLFGDVRPVGGGVSELRIAHGPGYRLYFVRRGPVVVVLLCGGDKGTQQRDIARAKELAAALEG